MTRAEATGILKEYAIFQQIEKLLLTTVVYSPGERSKRGTIQDAIISQMDCNGNNKIRNMITKVMKKHDMTALKYQGDRCYRNVTLRS